MVSEAVEEVLNLVQNATQTFKSMISVDSDILNKGLILFNWNVFHSSIIDANRAIESLFRRVESELGPLERGER